MTIKIADVLGALPARARDQLARRHQVAPERLANFYRGDWRSLIEDLTEAQLHKALKLLAGEELRAVAYRAFKFPIDQRLSQVTIRKKDGVSQPYIVPTVIKGVIGLDYGKKNVGRETFRALKSRLEELGLEVLDHETRSPLGDDDHRGRNDQVRLRRMFKR